MNDRPQRPEPTDEQWQSYADAYKQDDDLAAITVVTGTASTEETCYECGGRLPAKDDVMVTIGLGKSTGTFVIRFRCTSCHIDQD